jgi:hypothetical protein
MHWLLSSTNSATGTASREQELTWVSTAPAEAAASHKRPIGLGAQTLTVSALTLMAVRHSLCTDGDDIGDHK